MRSFVPIATVPGQGGRSEVVPIATVPGQGGRSEVVPIATVPGQGGRSEVVPIATVAIATPTPVPRETAPDFDLPAAGGGTVSLSQMLDGKRAAALVFYRGLF